MKSTEEWLIAILIVCFFFGGVLLGIALGEKTLSDEYETLQADYASAQARLAEVNTMMLAVEEYISKARPLYDIIESLDTLIQQYEKQPQLSVLSSP